MRRMRALLEDLRETAPEFRRAAIDAELALVNATTTRSFPGGGEQHAAAAADRQGLGSTATAPRGGDEPTDAGATRVPPNR
ncbi:hypothetical protein [Homoserinimonas sp. OAct 916]|uniref:hypothetical protein n=1 Tax=Homoserinimonas sp. OAct 916 TaxID=2211450 RepID=UPI000DBEA8A3|nr:hypothetical protein [Homoserinimonas sp. OAct 916]